MSHSRNARIVLALGVFLVLSVVVFGSIFYVAFCSCNVEIIASDSGTGYEFTENGFDSGQALEVRDYRGTIEVSPSYNPTWGIPRDGYWITPDYNPEDGIIRGPIEILPFYNPLWGIPRGPITLLPV
ncbi:MAG: hypothetical protein JW779_02065 [Candidatus Thorarchaeota archaeon]|nr:hypothetical protein [Candidatus Thorarchaeota archaeon]